MTFRVTITLVNTKPLVRASTDPAVGVLVAELFHKDTGVAAHLSGSSATSFDFAGVAEGEYIASLKLTDVNGTIIGEAITEDVTVGPDTPGPTVTVQVPASMSVTLTQE